MKDLKDKLDLNVPVDVALKQMGLTNPDLIQQIKDDLSFHAINSGAHNPGQSSDIEIDINGQPINPNNVNGIYNAGVNGVKQAADAAGNGIKDAANAAGNVANQAANAVEDAAAKAANAAADAAAKAANAVANPVDTAQNLASGAKNAIADGANALGNMFGGWGR